MLLNSSINTTLSEIEITIEDDIVFTPSQINDMASAIFDKMSMLFNSRLSKETPLIHPEHNTKILGVKQVKYASGNFVLVLKTDPFYIRLN